MMQKYESRPFRITFNGYTQLNGTYKFQIHLRDIASERQPGYLQKGDPLGYEGYVIGDFHLNIVNKENPATHVKEDIDETREDWEAKRRSPDAPGALPPDESDD